MILQPEGKDSQNNIYIMNDSVVMHNNDMIFNQARERNRCS